MTGAAAVEPSSAWARDTFYARLFPDQVEWRVSQPGIAFVLIGVPATGRLSAATLHVAYQGWVENVCDVLCLHVGGPCEMYDCTFSGLDIWKAFGPEPTGEAFWLAMEKVANRWRQQ